MTREDRELFLIDLSARLPYGVKITWDDKHPLTVTPHVYCAIISEDNINKIPKIFLRPMSSMTKEERRDFPFPYHFEWIDSNFSLLCSNDEVCASIGFDEMYEIMDWLNAHHFDYHGLIEKGLALEAPDGMYNL